MRIDPADAPAVEAAFTAAQARTSAPLACVVAESSADYALAPTLTAAGVALALPWPLIALTPWPASRIFLAQLAFFAVALAVLLSTAVRARLASRGRRRSACYRAAVVQFASRGLGYAPHRNGVLLYVSLTERYARIVADAGLETPHEAWRGVIDELTTALAAGDAKPALEAAAGRLGDLLGPIFPPTPGVEAGKRKHFYML